MLSVGSITNKGCHVVFSGRQSLIINSKDPTKVVVIGNKDDGNGLYKFQLQPNKIPSPLLKRNPQQHYGIENLGASIIRAHMNNLQQDLA